MNSASREAPQAAASSATPLPLPAAVFRPAAPHCPSCHGRLKNLGDSCELCQYSAWECVQRFPYQPPPLERFIDPEMRLTVAERAALNKEISRLQASYPQIQLHICLTRLPAGSDAREFGFWLFNASPVATPAEAERRTWDLLVVVDRGNRTASITAGYAIECFLSDDRLAFALAKSGVDFREGRFARGLQQIIRRLLSILATAHREAAYLADKYLAESRGGSRQKGIREFASLMRKGAY